VQTPRWNAPGLLWSLLAAALAPACAGVPPEVREAERLSAVLERVVAELPAERGLRVLLAFGPAADLDLYVTDPLEETVYFANSPSASGGRLEADLRCDSPGSGDRIEVVRFADPRAGRYRVGVDHPKGCGGEQPAGFALAVVRDGVAEIQGGSLRPLEFRLAALDFELDGAPGGAGESGE
jgi:hypothetical protein